MGLALMGIDVIVHVGYGKTATTWLQENIFSKVWKKYYLGKKEGDFPQWLLRLNYLDDMAFFSQKEQLRQEIRRLLEGRKKALISSEAFTNFGVIFQQVDRLSYVFGNPRIVIVLRHPIDWLCSNYKYCVEYENFSFPLENYIDFGERRTPFSLEKRAPFYLPDLFYDEIVAHYREQFGHDRVLVLRYEDFLNTPLLYLEKLADFVGLEIPSVADKLQQKMLSSKNGEILENIRENNIKKIIDSAGFTIDGMCKKSKMQKIMSAELKEKILNILMPHCEEFYS